jgi:uncharacterized protein (UPF0335 family)
VRKAREQLTLEYVAEVERLDAKRNDLKNQISDIVDEKNTALVDVAGNGKVGAG